MRVTITDDLNLRDAARTTMLSLKRPQQALLEKALGLLRRALFFQVRRADVERLSRARVYVSLRVRFLTVGIVNWTRKKKPLRTNETHRGIWKNISAFGFASFCTDGGCCWRAQTLPKSLPPSGVNGLTIGLIDSNDTRLKKYTRKKRKEKHT